jgi:LAO/AO transport system kinase
MVDGMAITKADGDNLDRAERARGEYASALHLFPASPDGWTPRVLTCSAVSGAGVAEIWQSVLEHRLLLEGNGWFAAQRADQALEWMRELVSTGLGDRFSRHPAVSARRPVLEDAVRHGQTTAFAAARELLGLFRV